MIFTVHTKIVCVSPLTPVTCFTPRSVYYQCSAGSVGGNTPVTVTARTCIGDRYKYRCRNRGKEAASPGISVGQTSCLPPNSYIVMAAEKNQSN